MYIDQSFLSFLSRWTFQPFLTDSTAWRTDRRKGNSIIARYKCCRALKMLRALYKNYILHHALNVNCRVSLRVVLTNSPANRLCYKLSRRRQSVPGTCSRQSPPLVKAYDHLVERRVDGMISVDVEADRRWRRTFTSVDLWNVGIVLVEIMLVGIAPVGIGGLPPTHMTIWFPIHTTFLFASSFR